MKRRERRQHEDVTEHEEPVSEPGEASGPAGGQGERDAGDEFEHELHEASADEIIDRAEHEVEDEMRRLHRELAEVEGRYKRALADYSNFQRRARLNEVEARQAGVRSVLESLIPAMDSFEVALSQDVTTPESAQHVLSGVQAIHDSLLSALERHGVGVIRPEVNEPFDPARHEAVAQHAAKGVEPGHVAAPLQVGFSIGERVVRPAKVAVAPSGEE